MSLPASPRKDGLQREVLLDGVAIAYTLKRSARRTFGLRVDARGLTVGVPLRATQRAVDAFLHDHARWILDKVQVHAARAEAPPFAVVEGAGLPVLGETWTLHLSKGLNRLVWHEGGVTADAPRILEITLRAGSDPAAVLRRGVQQRALEVFRHRVAEFCLRIGQPVPTVGLSSARTRWGSCSRRSGIRLHWRLIHLPLELVDYVAAHEVAHLLEMNHSPRFWSVVESVYPEHVVARARLRAVAASLPQL
ncbi:MAG TPA: SprT family zinc-dependent metalloprotease [Rhodocyclaceae bacterium]|nr:SprT family zinc-dependent metalloprotease [Rhodocyclaceae bacterium]HNI81828.1 SprT family zinc-dependent metalloprotease [Rhodocyclaceae bacterium]